MVLDNNYHRHHQDWQSPGSAQMGTASQQVLEMVRRITEPLYPALRWLRLASRFDIEPHTFASRLTWLDSLIKRLQSASYWSTLFRRQESLPFLQSPHFVWFDPRYWLNRMGRGDNPEHYDTDDEAGSNDKAIPEFMPANSPITIAGLKQSFLARQSGLPRVRQFRTLTNPAVFSHHGQEISADVYALEEQISHSKGENETYPRQIVTDSLLSRHVDTGTPVMRGPEQEPHEFIITKQQINKIASTTPALEAVSRTNEYHQPIDRTQPSQSVDTVPLIKTVPVEERTSKFTRVISKVWDKISSPLTTQLKQAKRLIRAEKTKGIPENSQSADATRQINLNIKPPVEIQPEPSHEMVKEPVERTLPEQPPELVFPMHMVHVRLSDTASAEITMPDEAVPYSNEQTEEKIPVEPIWTHYPTVHMIPADLADDIGISSQETDSGTRGPGGLSRNGDFSGQRAGVLSLALAPTARSPQTSDRTTSQATAPNQRTATERTVERTPSYDPELVAAEVYSILKRRLVIERERAQGIL